MINKETEFDFVIFGASAASQGYAKGVAGGGSTALVLDFADNGVSFPDGVKVIRNVTLASIDLRPITEAEKLKILRRQGPLAADPENALNGREIACVVLTDGRTFTARHQYVDTTDDADIFQMAAEGARKAA